LTALFIGIVSIALSIYYSAKWGFYIGQPWFIAIPSAFVYIVFVNLVFEMGVGLVVRFRSGVIYIHRLEKKDKPIAVLFLAGRIGGAVFAFLAWALIVVYSMASTVGGQYEQIVEAERTREAVVYVQDDGAILDKFEIELQIYIDEKADLDLELPTLLDRVATLNTAELAWEYKGTLDRAQNRIDEIRTRKREIDTEIRRIGAEIGELKSVNNDFQVDSGSAFSYFARITGYGELEVQFFLSLFPSLFIDIIAPIALAIALYKKE
jgi:hypothetical protein